MLETSKNESQKLVDDEDELDLSFAVYAKCMRLFLTNDQKEELNTVIGNLVSTAIGNVKAGMAVLQKAPVSSKLSNHVHYLTFRSHPRCNQCHMFSRVKPQ